jgi:hypothetical protein
MKYRIRLRRQPGHHWKLITATLVALGLASGVALITEHLTVGFALLLGMATLATQWFCIDVPGVDDADPH